MSKLAGQPTIVSHLDRVVGEHSSNIAVVDNEIELTYREFWRKCEDIARGIVALDVSVGDRVALAGSNSAEYIIAYLGILRSGAVVVPLNNLLDEAALSEQVTFGDVRFCIVTDAEAIPTLKLSDLTPVFRIEDILTAELADKKALPSLSASSDAAILMSSGSTGGGPKGIIHTHESIMHATGQFMACYPINSSDVTIAFLPLFTAMGEQVLPILAAGASVIVIPKFDVDAINKACRRASTLDIIPTLMARLLSNGDLDAINSLDWVVFASEPMPPSLLEHWWAAAPDVQTYQFYGMTELLTMTYAPPPIQRGAPNSVGVPFPTSSIDVLDADGHALPPLHEGEILCSSPSMMRGYFRDPATTEAITIGENSMRTGDVGYRDEHGRVFLTGRLKDVIISGGMNVAPSEVEAVASEHSAVLAATVVGIPDSRWGETPVVIYVARPDQFVDPFDVLRFCRQKLSGYKRPSAVGVVDELPRTGIGKVAKSELKKAVEQGGIKLVRAS